MVGNTTIDSLVLFEERFRSLQMCGVFGLERGEYLLVTLHRPTLVDGPLLTSSSPIWTRWRPKYLFSFPSIRARESGSTRVATPVFGSRARSDTSSFLSVEADARGVLTDSGGVQEETTYLGIPCFTLRSTTERPVTIRSGTNTLLGFDPDRVCDIPEFLASAPSHSVRPPLWDGSASERVVEVVIQRGSSSVDAK